MLREKGMEIDGTLHPDSQSGLSKAQLEVLVLFQLEENSGVNSGAYSSQRQNSILIRRLKKFLTIDRALPKAT